MTELHNKTTFDEQIKPLMDEMIRRCGRYKIPCFMTFAVDNTEEKTTYINNGIMTKSRNIELADDKIKDHLLIQSGFTAKPDFKDIDGFISTKIFHLQKMVEAYKQAQAQEQLGMPNCYQNVKSKIRYWQNRESENEKSAEYRKQHIEKSREYYRKYAKKNAEKLKARRREYYLANKKRISERQKQYYQQNRERILEQKRQYSENKKNEDNGQ